MHYMPVTPPFITSPYIAKRHKTCDAIVTKR